MTNKTDDKSSGKKEEAKKEEKKKKSHSTAGGKLWLILGNEALPLGIAVAKTEGGAKKVHQARTGQSRDSIYVEELKFHKQYVGFTPLT